MSQTTNSCNCNYSISEISEYFGESEESMKKCNGCDNFSYENGEIQCRKLLDSIDTKGEN